MTVGPKSHLITAVPALPIQLLGAVVPQVKLLFRTVLHMAQHDAAKSVARRLLDLQRSNGVVYDLRYWVEGAAWTRSGGSSVFCSNHTLTS